MSAFTVPSIRPGSMRAVTLRGTSNSGTIPNVGTPDFSTGPRSKSTTSIWHSRLQRELTVNQLSGKLGADHIGHGDFRHGPPHRRIRRRRNPARIGSRHLEAHPP